MLMWVVVLHPSPAESALRLLGEALKGAGIIDGQISKNFAIQLHATLLQTVDELAVAQPVLLGCSPNTYDPQRAELAFFLAAAGVGKFQPTLDRFFGRAIELGFSKKVAAGAIKYLFALGAALGSTLYTRHVV